MKKWIVLFLLVAYGPVFAQVNPGLNFEKDPRLIDAVNRASAHFHPDNLPIDSPYRLTRATCGTMALMGLRSNRDALSPATKLAFSGLLQGSRPTRTQSVTSRSGRFMIHYNTTGTHAVSLVDANSNGIPDYVDETINAFETSWTKEVTELGYSPPPSDGDAIYDIYISSLGTQSA
ncbi:MAG: hypothetical protein O3B73_14270, partial [bacterium]|nr:hypothetical protein [bacterium]